MRALFFSLLLLLSAPALTWAADTAPRFHSGAADIREQQVVDMLESKAGLIADLPFTIAPFDLNGDGVNEWIVRQDTASNCAAQATCQFYIAGLKQGAPIMLGIFQAGKLNVLEDKLYGIHKLAVYNDASDDYSYTLYAWSPQKYSFQPF